MNSTVVIDFADQLWSCGNNINGQLGLGDFENRNILEKINMAEETNFKKVSAGRNFMVALDYNGVIWVCGDNTQGQLSKGFLNNENETPGEHAFLNKIEIDKFFIEVSAGHDFFFAIDDEGYLWSCGNNRKGQLGQNDKTKNFTMLTQIPNTNKFLSVSCGGKHILALDDNNEIWGCGHNDIGQLGVNNNTKKIYSLIKIDLNIKVKLVTCGYNFTFLIDSENTLWSCGNNHFGQLCLGFDYDDTDEIFVYTFTKVFSQTLFKYVSCGNYHTLALDVDGNIWSCGDNKQGQLGLGDYTKRKSLTLSNFNNAVAVSCLGFHSLVIDSNSHLWTCGSNDFGQLSFGTESPPKKNIFENVVSDVAFLVNQKFINEKYIKSANF